MSIYNLIFGDVLYIILYMSILKRLAAGFFVALSALTFALSVGSCSAGDVMDLYAFGAPVHVEVYGKKISEQTRTEIKELFSSLENTFSARKQNSFTARFNAAGANEKIAYGQTEAELLDVSSRCFELSGGKFDATVFPLVKLWKFYPGFPVYDFAPPSDDEIREVIQSGIIGYENVNMQESGVIYKENAGTQLDFGAVLKGYAAEKAAEILKRDGHNSGYVNAGGSSLYLLSVSSLGIRHPRKSGNIAEFNLKDKQNLSVSTSGDYEKTYAYQGRTYCHIIDAKTGLPADTGVASATIIGANAAVSDGLTTALVLCEHTPEEGASPEKSVLIQTIYKILREEDCKNAIFAVVFDDGEYKQFITNAEDGAFTLSDDDYEIVRI